MGEKTVGSRESRSGRQPRVEKTVKERGARERRSEDDCGLRIAKETLGVRISHAMDVYQSRGDLPEPVVDLALISS